MLFVVVYDVYATILHARARAGPVSDKLNRGVWHIARWVGFKFARPRRHRLLNTIGPLLLPLLIAIYITLLVVGFALIYLPRMPAQFSVAPGSVSEPFIEAIYFSSVTLTTVGYGDIVPRSTAMRLVALAQAATGFALISLAVTYLITVFGALERKRAVALSFYHQAEEGADVAGFIAHHFVGNRFFGLENALQLASRDVQELSESHVEHPVIHFFHPVEVHKSLPRVLFLVLETSTVIQSCLDENEYVETHSHPEVRTLEASAYYVLNQLTASLKLERAGTDGMAETRFEESRRWAQRFKDTMGRLTEAGIKVREQRDVGWEKYRARRESWERKLYLFSAYLGYDWDEITGDRDLRYAADEEMEAPHLDAPHAKR